MSKLLKLQISGIRSFGPYEEQIQTINFESPVTLILGQNGSGKTTIVECIRYACSGAVPAGTDSGKGFVNDPKISGTSSTKGQIKLKFLDPKKNQITISRVVEVTQKATNQTFKSKSATIRRITPEGEDISTSERCVDINSECCQFINVSSSVLNNVIFCHQENSLWPLEEGKKVKEKFDEIFDAQKYNKCSDKLRDLLKKKEQSLNLLKKELYYKKDKKQQVDKQKRQVEDKKERAQVMEDEIKRKNSEVEPLKSRMNDILKLEQQLGGLQQKLAAKRATKNGVIEEQKTIKKNLPFEFDGQDHELQSKIEQFDKEKAKDETLIMELEQRRTEIDEKNRQILKAIQEAQTELGKMNQQKDQFHKKCSERKNLLQQIKIKMDFKDLHEFETNDDAKNALYELKSEHENYLMELAGLEHEEEQEQKNLQSKVDDLRGASVRTQQQISSKQQEIKDGGKKITDISNQLITISASDDLIKGCNKKIEDIDIYLCKLKSSFREDEEVKTVDTYRNDIRTNENLLENLENDYKILLQNDVTESKIDTEKQTIANKKRAINQIMSQHADSLKQLFKETIPEKLKESVLSKQKQADVAVKALSDKIATKQKEVTTLEVQQQHDSEKIKSSEKELRLNRNKIAQACNGKDFNETLESTSQRKERLQIDKGQYTSIKIIYGQFVKKFEQEVPCCPVCETNFTNQKSVVGKIVQTLKNKLERVPQQLVQVENELQKEESLFNKLQQLKLVYEEIVLLTEKLPQMKQKFADVDAKLNDSKTELNALKLELEQHTKIVEICKSVISDVSSLDQHQSDIIKSEKNLQTLKLDLKRIESNKTKHEIEAEIEQLKSEISLTRGKIDAKIKLIDKHKNQIQKLLQERSTQVEKQMRLKDHLQSRPALEKQKMELEARIKNINEEISALHQTLSLQENDLKNAVNTKQKLLEKSKKVITDYRNKISDFEKTMHSLNKLQKEIDSYLGEGIDEKLVETENKLKECKDKEKILEETKTKIFELITRKKEDMAKEELRYRTLKNNVILREKQVLEIKLTEEIEDLEKQIEGFNFRTVHEEKLRLQQKKEKLDKEINNLSGEKNGMVQQIKELEYELQRPENRNATKSYMETFYKCRIEELSILDLAKYTHALEKAVLDFHQAKMVQINRTIRDLWRNTYRGNDIDYIEIKTEHPKTNAARRTYNYKVVQVKKGVELDMRGRCSAGQKVLCCLLIRMALAETMSCNCGILALDEPTTNLDKDNVLSLCDTLMRIINSRQSEKAFQLIIITHDEEFIQALSRVQGVTGYYRIKRSRDGFSLIQREDVTL